MKILNLYAGIGGNRKLWGDDHKITAVEYDPYIADVYKTLYPNDTVVITDAHQYLLDHYKEYDFIWASPPCPTHSKARAARVHGAVIAPKYPDMKLYEEVIFLKHFFKGDWVVENVTSYYSPLIKPMAVVERHYIWSNKYIADKVFKRDYNIGAATTEQLSNYHQIVLPEGTKYQRKLLRNAVLPEMGKYILEYFESYEIQQIVRAHSLLINSNTPVNNRRVLFYDGTISEEISL